MRTVARFLPLAAFIALTACADPEPAPVEVSERISTSAVVQTVDMETRQVLLRGENGALETIVAGPEVRNLAQLAPGDRVIAVYERSVAARMAPAGAEKGAMQTSAAAVAAPGQRPGAVAADEVVAVVDFLSYDAATNTARVRDGDGFVHAIQVREPAMQAFAASLAPGARVEVVFTEAVAVGVEEVS